MQYKVKNVTMHIEITSGQITGDCIVYIPKANKRFFEEWCGIKHVGNGGDEYKPVYHSDYGPVYFNKAIRKYHSDSPDMLICYMSWLLTEPGEQIIEVEYSNPFWAIHDAEHAQHDESGCTIYVDEHIERERLHEAFKLMKANGFEPDYELIQEVEEAYRGRFGKFVSFEEYLEPEYAEDEEY